MRSWLLAGSTHLDLAKQSARSPGRSAIAATNFPPFFNGWKLYLAAFEATGVTEPGSTR